MEAFSWAVGGAGVELGLRESPPSGGAVSYVPTLDVQMLQSTPRCVPMHGWLSGLFTGQLWRKRHPWFWQRPRFHRMQMGCGGFEPCAGAFLCHDAGQFADAPPLHVFDPCAMAT